MTVMMYIPVHPFPSILPSQNVVHMPSSNATRKTTTFSFLPTTPSESLQVQLFSVNSFELHLHKTRHHLGFSKTKHLPTSRQWEVLDNQDT